MNYDCESAMLINKYIEYSELLKSLYNVSDGLFCGITKDNEVHIATNKYMELVEELGADVTYNPEWSANYPDITEAHFYYEYNKVPYKVFTLFKKEELDEINKKNAEV